MIPFRLTSPVTGRELTSHGPHSLAGEAGERWPVVDGIAYLRTGRDDLVRDVLARLDGGEGEEALVLLLADQDEWWDGPPPSSARLRALVKERGNFSLRQAVDYLGYGRVGDYFLHRWSDPTYLAGLALLEAHWNRPRCVFELACGLGHYLRELHARGHLAAGADVVFSKLWLARHWVLGDQVQLVCFDAGASAAGPHGFPIEGAPVDLVMCQDAFYFLEPKPEIAACMRKLAGEDGWITVGHIHNRERPGFSAGQAMSAAEVEELFPDALVYDDAELTRALVEARAPVPAAPEQLRTVEAFSLVCGPGMRPAPRAVTGGLALPRADAELRRNPLYRRRAGGGYAVAWPTDRYRAEYAGRATYPEASEAPRHATLRPETELLARRRELLDLPARW